MKSSGRSSGRNRESKNGGRLEKVASVGKVNMDSWAFLRKYEGQKFRMEDVLLSLAGAGRIHHESAGAIKSKPEAERADAQEQLGPPYVHVWVAFLRSLAATRGLAPEHAAALNSYWESNVVKSAPVQLAAHVRHCRAKPCKKIEGKEGWTRIVFCLDPVTLPLKLALEATLQL